MGERRRSIVFHCLWDASVIKSILQSCQNFISSVPPAVPRHSYATAGCRRVSFVSKILIPFVATLDCRSTVNLLHFLYQKTNKLD